MLWNQLISQTEELVLPWMGGQTLHSQNRRWSLTNSPPEHGWHRFRIDGSRRAAWICEDFAPPEPLPNLPLLRGYLVGDRLICDDATVTPDPAKAFQQSEKVWLLDHTLERFTRILAARHRSNHLVYVRQEFPLGPEADVLTAWQDRRPDVANIPGVTPALDLTFRWLTHQRILADARRERMERELARQAEAEARREAEAQAAAKYIKEQQTIYTKRVRDFEGAARAALSVSGAELLDHRPAQQKTEAVVQFRFQQQRFECVVNRQTLQIIDAGICLMNHATDERGDSYFTLESLPAVIHEAMRRGVLVVFRHVR